MIYTSTMEAGAWQTRLGSPSFNSVRCRYFYSSFIGVFSGRVMDAGYYHHRYSDM